MKVSEFNKERLHSRMEILLSPLKIQNSLLKKHGDDFRFTCESLDYSSMDEETKKEYYLKVVYALNQVFAYFNVKVEISLDGKIEAQISIRGKL